MLYKGQVHNTLHWLCGYLRRGTRRCLWFTVWGLHHALLQVICRITYPFSGALFLVSVSISFEMVGNASGGVASKLILKANARALTIDEQALLRRYQALFPPSWRSYHSVDVFLSPTREWYTTFAIYYISHVRLSYHSCRQSRELRAIASFACASLGCVRFRECTTSITRHYIISSWFPSFPLFLFSNGRF